MVDTLLFMPSVGNQSFIRTNSISTFPDGWKRARITPVFKKGDSTNLKNYRPIAILSNFAKLCEIVLYKTIFVNVQSHVSAFQHGFWPGRSTVTNLCTLTQFLSEELDNNGQVDVIYTDFSLLW
mgnify:CR=1 FL=1